MILLCGPTLIQDETLQSLLKGKEEVTTNIYNIHGQSVRRLVNDKRQAGFHEIAWDSQDDAGRNMPSGVYLYRIHAGGFMEVKKLMLLR
jgi:flagellar hook assembly protein FlgD